VFATPAVLVDGARRSLMPVVLAGVTLATLAAYGGLRLASHPTETVDGVHLRIMQPNIPQDERFRYAAKAQIMRRYVLMSQRADEAALPPHPPAQAGDSLHSYAPQDSYPSSRAEEGIAGDPGGLRGVTHLIWPESAFPFFLTREPDALSMIAHMLAPSTTLITGAARLAEPVPGRREKRAYNSVYVIDHSGSILATYDKLHLVPFGEYLPFQDLLERAGLTQLIDVPGGFLPGAQRHRIAVPGAPDMLPLICYEAIFPGEAVPTDERPSWLLNLTNDAWFGISSGPYQHFQQARVRAIEEGLPLIRAANSGISAVIDPLGRVIAALPLGHEGLLDSALPRAAEMTIYARAGDFLFGAGALATMVASLLVRLMREQPTQIL
jgi:apolipoprotein N-acyltransferase